VNEGEMADDQSAAIDFVLRANRDAPAQRIDTHSAIVILSGDRVFKLKRAVKLSFLDYSTLEQRVACCQAEYDLNRRAAPDLYRGVRRITRTERRALEGDGLEWDGRGALVEPVLEMTRFDDEALFDRLATAGKLTPAVMVQLGDIIAAFHAGAEETPRFGGRRGIADVIADNRDNVLQGCPPLDRARMEQLTADSNKVLARYADLLDRRQAQGKVRRCHGDLHLRNICLFNDVPTLFDCIDFNDDIACIDTLFDLAFLLMDLDYRKLRPLGNVVFNRYIDRTGEDAALGVLPLLMSVRAGIRAKVGVASLKLHPEAAAEAKAYLDLAGELLAPGTPRLVAIGGLSGSGKSTVAARLAGDFAPAPGARHIRSDVVRKILMGVAPETKLPASAYRGEVSDRVHGRIREQAAAALEAGYSAIVDATWMAPAERASIAGVARQAGISFTGLWLTAPQAVLEERVSRRKGDASDADRRVLLDQLKADLGPMDWASVDVSGDPAAALAAARAALKS
jgi:aminoglycoside phosphotransferase family enzyme/predicted kinase